MRYYRHSATGEVFAFETEQERDKWGAPELVEMEPDEVEAHLNPPIDPERVAVQARNHRDSLLASSDWVVIRAQELGQPIPQDWLDYRQALRDVPEQAGFPEHIEWPTLPEGEP